MSDTLQFTSAVLKSFGRDKNGGHAVFAANYLPKSSCDELGWGGISAGAQSVKLIGELHATHAILIPKEKPLAKHKIDFDINEVSDFQAFRLELEGSKGKGTRLELRFKVHSAAVSMCRALEEYMMTIGEGKSTLQISYVKQGNLLQGEEDDLAGDERRQATMAAND